MFTKYSSIIYDGVKIRNILEKYVIYTKTIGDKQSIYQDYIIIDWESPETVAYNIYDNCNYHWAVLLANNIVDPFYDWLLKEEELRYYIEKTYGNKMHDAHHYELNGIIYKDYVPNSIKVSNLQHEFDMNEKKRKIKVIIPSFINKVRDALFSKSK